MKFTIETKDLIRGINQVIGSVPGTTTIAVLKGIKLECTYNGITLTGSNLDISEETFIPDIHDDRQVIEVEKEGSVLVPAALFENIVKRMPGEDIHIEVVDKFVINISSGTSNFQLNGMDPSEYPNIQATVFDEIYQINQSALKTIIKQTIFAVSKSENRPILTGVNFSLLQGILSIKATDSHRFSEKRIPLNCSGEFNFTVPGKSLSELYKVLTDDKEMEFQVGENQVVFKVGNLTFYSRLLSGNFPNTNPLIPKDSKTVLKFGRKELLSTIERVTLLASSEKSPVVYLETRGDIVGFNSESKEIGVVNEEMKPSEFTGESLKIAFNGRYMKEALKAFENDTVEIQLNGFAKPFKLFDAEDKNYTQLLLPIRAY